MNFRHVISTSQFLNQDLLSDLFALADEMERGDQGKTLAPTLRNKIMATVFYEPSTRTRFSFECAMQKLGGSIITTENAASFSSAAKGESLQDSIRVISGYADVIVLRHPEKGSSQIASEVSSVPIINAGDGAGEHPTQALLDLYTIKKELGTLENLKIAVVGDLLHGRTVHSLTHLLTLYPTNTIYLVSPSQLQLPDNYKENLRNTGVSFQEFGDLKEVLGNADVVYMTRIQKERFSSEEEYEKLKSSYVFDRRALSLLKESAIILHPLPRVTEISSLQVDQDRRAAYFRQAKNGVYIRMALLQMILGNEKNP